MAESLINIEKRLRSFRGEIQFLSLHTDLQVDHPLYHPLHGGPCMHLDRSMLHARLRMALSPDLLPHAKDSQTCANFVPGQASRLKAQQLKYRAVRLIQRIQDSCHISLDGAVRSDLDLWGGVERG